MRMGSLFDVAIIGGGLAGLTSALHLAKEGVKVVLFEKHSYPNHKVCGEYVSNEVSPYLSKLGVDPISHGAVPISKFEISTKDGNIVQSNLPLGGFGISRYSLDDLLYQKASQYADFIFDTVERVSFESEIFDLTTVSKDVYQARFVVGAFGKRSLLDNSLGRKFIQQKSPWLGVKAHYEYDLNKDTVALHNFEGGYCGLSTVETGAVNACYLATYDSFKTTKNVGDFQRKVMSQNPRLAHFFDSAQPLFKKPITISQISFQKKNPVEQHIFMIGDSAGLIHPLCGNGMAMAIHSAKLFSELFLSAFKNETMRREDLEKKYSEVWKKTFNRRLQTGRFIQNLLLRPTTADFGLRIAQQFPSIVPRIIKETHGELLV